MVKVRRASPVTGERVVAVIVVGPLTIPDRHSQRQQTGQEFICLVSNRYREFRRGASGKVNMLGAAFGSDARFKDIVLSCIAAAHGPCMLGLQ